jgi:hypothetical protein
VHPTLIDAYLRGRTVAETAPLSKRSRRAGGGAALRRDEVAVLQFLQEELVA